MFRGLFGDVTNGRLARLPFLGYWALIFVLMIAVGIGVAVTIGAAEHLIGGDLQGAQDQLLGQVGAPAVVVHRQRAHLLADRRSDPPADRSEERRVVRVNSASASR